MPAWSVGVLGCPKCTAAPTLRRAGHRRPGPAMAWTVMNSRVEPGVVCGTLSDPASRIGRSHHQVVVTLAAGVLRSHCWIQQPYWDRRCRAQVAASKGVPATRRPENDPEPFRQLDLHP
jgi:hypothetical protein